MGRALHPAWSVKLAPPRLVVAISPVRQTLQIAGSIGTVVGAGITAVQNANYRSQIGNALDGYDTTAVIKGRVESAIASVLEGKGTRVDVFEPHDVEGTTVREAAQERFRRIAKAGHDQVLDVAVTHGVYGVNGELVVRLQAEIHAVPSGKLLWKQRIAVRGGDPLAFRSLDDPTKRLTPNLFNPRLASKADAVSQWTDNGGARLKSELERVSGMVLAGMQMSLGGEETPDGLFAVGTDLMYHKKFAEAEALLDRARVLAPERSDISNTLAVDLGHQGKVDDAIALAEKLAAPGAADAVAHINLAWWYAIDKLDLEKARHHYAEATKLGMAPVRKLDKRLTRFSK